MEICGGGGRKLDKESARGKGWGEGGGGWASVGGGGVPIGGEVLGEGLQLGSPVIHNKGFGKGEGGKALKKRVHGLSVEYL